MQLIDIERWVPEGRSGGKIAENWGGQWWKTPSIVVGSIRVSFNCTQEQYVYKALQ